MQRIAFIVLTTGLLVSAQGCTPTTRIIGHDTTTSRRFTNDVGVTGHRTNLTIEAGSQVPKLSIIGNDCTITVQDGADVARIEFWGNGNTVSLPHDLLIYLSQAGANRIVHRTSAEPRSADANIGPE